jgi:hypothetical protein
LALLDQLASSDAQAVSEYAFSPGRPEVILALARYAAALARTPKAAPEFQVRVTYEPSRRGASRSEQFRAFDLNSVGDFLDAGPTRSVLIGSPGAGKTYSFKQSVSRLAEQLYQECLSESFDCHRSVVPLYADFKLYRGDIFGLIAQNLPSSLPLEEVLANFPTRIFLDSFNEMPREYWESGAYESDITNFIRKIGNAALVFGSRTRDGLEKLDFPLYRLDLVDRSHVDEELWRRRILLHSRFSEEIRALLQRPFYFQHILNGTAELGDETHPRDFFELFFARVQRGFVSRFKIKADLKKALSLVAYAALDRR